MNSDFKERLEALCRLEVRFPVVGGYAVMHHTEPRFTKDLDIWVDDGCWERRAEAAVGSIVVPMIGLDDLIVAKERAGRDQDRIDLVKLRKAREG